MKKVLFFFFGILYLSSATAQGKFSFESIIGQVSSQISLYPQEKIHLHIDKSQYLTGETIWFRAYVVNSIFHTISECSQYLYAELVDPFGAVVSRVKLRPVEKALYGDILLSDNLPEGDYTLRAYTMYMTGLGEDYFFRRSIKILSSRSARLNTRIKFLPAGEGVSEFIFSFEDANTGRPLSGEAKVFLNKAEARTVTARENGSFSVSVPQEKLRDNSPMLIEFTDKSRLVYRKYIGFHGDSDDYDVSFFPEGGLLLSGVLCRLAFKALNSEGLSEKVTIDLVDEQGDTLATASTLHEGMGYLSLFPEEGKQYYALCKNENGRVKKNEIPETQTRAHALKVDQTTGRIIVAVQSASGAGQDSLFLLAHVRGAVVYAGFWDYNKPQLVFSEQSFPSGVIQFLLLDRNLAPVSERLVFVNNNDQAKVWLSAGQDVFNLRELVTARVKVTEPNNIPLKGNFSVSVVDLYDVPADTCFPILSTLLLTSELRGYIKSPAFYFQKDNRTAAIALDLLMMTHGWRRYNLPEIMRGNPQRPDQRPETSHHISGTVKGGLLMNKPEPDAVVTIISMNGRYMDADTTSRDGRFSFEGLEFADSTGFMVQAKTAKGRDHLELTFDEEQFPEVKNKLPLVQDANMAANRNFILKAEQKMREEGGMPTVVLDELEVTAEKSKFKEGPAFIDYETYTAEDIEKGTFADFRSILEQLMRIPYDMNSNGPVYRNQELFFVVDGLEHQYADLETDLVVQQIKEIQLVRDPLAATYYGGGVDRYSATIMVTTKRGLYVLEKPDFNSKFLMPLGYQKPAEFYAPKYETAAEKESNPDDFRTTIYWDPNVKISDDGEASFAFYTAGTQATYSFIIEGMTDNGKIIRSMQKIKVK